MNPSVNPVVGTFIIILGLLFAFLFIAWCCKQCSQSKQTFAPLICPQDSLYSRRYLTAIDVQTGLPVIIQTMGRSSNLVRVTSMTNDGRHSINSSRHIRSYGSIVHNIPPHVVDIIARTPPPPYTEAYVQPRSVI